MGYMRITAGTTCTAANKVAIVSYCPYFHGGAADISE